MLDALFEKHTIPMLMQFGEFFKVAERRVSLLQLNEHHCFLHALYLAVTSEDNLSFAHGVALDEQAVRLAWCVDDGGTVVDPASPPIQKHAPIY